MVTRPAVVKQAAIARALRAAKKAGAKKVTVGPDGHIDIVLECDQVDNGLPRRQPDNKIRASECPVKRIVF